MSIVRRLAAGLKASGLIAREDVPGDDVPDEELRRVRPRSRLGPPRVVHVPRSARREDGGVLSSDFKVHGIDGLRVVDASVFPRIPGFFIVSAVYMIGEKAADVIAAAAATSQRLGPVRPFAI